MAYVSPSTRATDYVVTAANWNADVVGNVKWLAEEKPRARVYNSANFSHSSSGNFVAVTFNSERFDVGGMHSTSSNTSRLTVPSGGGGVYLIGGHCDFAANATGARWLRIRLNGTTYIGSSNRSDGDGTYGSSLNVSTMYALAAGDYVELMAYQDSGGSLNINATGNWSPEFWAIWMGT